MDIEYRIVRSDSEIRWVHCRGFQVRDANGVLIRITGIARDVTQRKQTEEALRRSEELYRTLAESAQDVIFVINRHYCLDYGNQEMARLLGLSPAELIGRPVSRFSQAEAVTQQRRHFDTVIESGRPLRFEEKLSFQNVEMWFGTQFVPIRNPAGEVSGVLGVARDITEHKHAENKIREQAALLDQAHEAITVRDLEGRLLYWNRGAQQLYGWSAAEVLCRVAEEFFAKEKAAQFGPIKERVLQSAEWAGELNNVTKAGQKLVVMSRWTLIRDEGQQPKSILIIDTDVTEQKKLEAQFFRAQRMDSLGILASGIAHDLNNILAPTLMTAHLLREINPSPEAEELIASLESNAQRGADIVKQLLVFGRGVSTERTTLNAIYLVKEVAKMATQTFPKNVRISTTISEDLWPILANATQIQQVLMNLSLNARDAMPQGGELTLSVANQIVDEEFVRRNPGSHTGPHAVIGVHDTGSGIPAEILDRIFEPFYTTKEVGKGTGLGLSTVMGIAKGHEGFVTVETQVGRGTEFKAFFPATPGQTAGLDILEKGELARGSGELVLVVDDEANLRKTVETFLQKRGYRVLTAADGAEALSIYAKNSQHINAVLTDLAMANMDGVLLTRLLKTLNPRLGIVVTTGLAEESKIQELRSLGVSNTLQKPYTLEALLAALAVACQHQPETGADPSGG